LLAELRRLRAIQIAQGDALHRGDLDALDTLAQERATLQGTLRPLDGAGLPPADLAEARALVELLVADQEALVVTAAEIRDRLGAEIGDLKRGRTAVAGYRPHAASQSLYLDSAR
jgi:hypothetical protein